MCPLNTARFVRIVRHVVVDLVAMVPSEARNLLEDVGSTGSHHRINARCPIVLQIHRVGMQFGNVSCDWGVDCRTAVTASHWSPTPQN